MAMAWVIFASLVIAFINWVVLKEIRTDWIHYPGSRPEQYLWLLLLGIFDLLSVGSLWFVAKKIKNVFRIFISFLGFAKVLEIARFHQAFKRWPS